MNLALAMDRKRKGLFILPLVLIIAVLSLFLPTPVRADNSVPDVAVALSETSMNPQTEYTITVTVTDTDGYSDIASVVFKLYYDSDTATNQTEFDENTTANAQTLAYITWTSGGGFVLSEETGSSWAMGTCSTPAEDDLANPFVFKITPGKVSSTADNSTDCWQIAALVTDNGSETAWNADNERAAMNWYGEVIANTTIADFGAVVPGSEFAANTVGSLSLTYIANGPYDVKVKVAANAFAGGTGTVTVDVTDFNAEASNEVAFKADDDNTLDGAVGLTETGATISSSGTQTGESGDTVTINQLWMKMNSNYTCTGEKSGSIYFIITDGS